MIAAAKEVIVEFDVYRVARRPSVLVAQLQAAVAICVHDDTQGIAGLLHLRYVATHNNRPLELTDNTLSSSILLLDRFCKELKSNGARMQAWRVRIIAHTPPAEELAAPVATVLDLLKAYFSDIKVPPDIRQINRPAGCKLSVDAHEGRMWINGSAVGLERQLDRAAHK